MPTKKPEKTAGGSEAAAKPASKTNQTAAKKSAINQESDELTETPARKTRPSPPAPVVRKMTPQRQEHLRRARRRKRNQRIFTTVAILVVVALVGLAAWQIIQRSTKTTVTSAGATTTAEIKATATTTALCPDTPPDVTGTPTTTDDGLQYIDTQVGTGDTVKEGDSVNMIYVGWVQSTDVRFDCSYQHGSDPIPFTLTQGSIIQGWIEGVSGMKVGGKRRLIIPPSLGYGDTAQGSIPANSTLIFDVEVVSIGSSSSGS